MIRVKIHTRNNEVEEFYLNTHSSLGTLLGTEGFPLADLAGEGPQNIRTIQRDGQHTTTTSNAMIINNDIILFDGADVYLPGSTVPEDDTQRAWATQGIFRRRNNEEHTGMPEPLVHPRRTRHTEQRPAQESTRTVESLTSIMQAYATQYLTDCPQGLLSLSGGIRFLTTAPGTPEPGVTIVISTTDAAQAPNVQTDVDHNAIVIKSGTTVSGVDLCDLRTHDEHIHSYTQYLINIGEEQLGRIPAVRRAFVAWAEEHMATPLAHWHQTQRPQPIHQLRQIGREMQEVFRNLQQDLHNIQDEAQQYRTQHSQQVSALQQANADLDTIHAIPAVDVALIDYSGRDHATRYISNIELITHPISTRFRGPGGSVEKNLGRFLIVIDMGREPMFSCTPLDARGTFHPDYSEEEQKQVSLLAYITPLLQAAETSLIDAVSTIIRILERPVRSLPNYARLADAPDVVAAEAAAEAATEAAAEAAAEATTAEPANEATPPSSPAYATHTAGTGHTIQIPPHLMHML